MLPEDKALTAIQEFLLIKKGVDSREYKLNYLKRRLAVRMRALGILYPFHYLKVLKDDETEADKLIVLLTIGVTEFFRDHDVFETFQQKLLPEIVKTKNLEKNSHLQSNLKIWSAGCSSGEETFSIAISILETVSDKNIVSSVIIEGTDIDTKGLETAKAAVYPEKSLINMQKQIVDRYFDSIEGGFEVKDFVKKLVHFKRCDFTTEQTKKKYDVIFCRNVLIYFTKPLQQRLLEEFTNCLQTGGYLILGKTEALFPPVRDLYACTDLKARIFRKN